VSQAVLFCTY